MHGRACVYVLDVVAVSDDLLGTKLILDCDAPSGKINFSRNSVFIRPLATSKQQPIVHDQRSKNGNQSTGGIESPIHHKKCSVKLATTEHC